VLVGPPKKGVQAMDSGFIKIYRLFLEWEWYDDINTSRLFLHLLLKANFKDKKWHGIDVKRGEILTGRKELSKQTGLSEQQVRSSLNKLKSTSGLTFISQKTIKLSRFFSNAFFLIC